MMDGRKDRWKDAEKTGVASRKGRWRDGGATNVGVEEEKGLTEGWHQRGKEVEEKMEDKKDGQMWRRMEGIPCCVLQQPISSLSLTHTQFKLIHCYVTSFHVCVCLCMRVCVCVEGGIPRCWIHTHAKTPRDNRLCVVCTSRLCRERIIITQMFHVNLKKIQIRFL